MHRRELKILEKCYPSGHMNTANTLNNMAAVLRDQENYDEALKYLQQVLKIKQELYPSRHLDIAASLNNIGLIFADKGDYDGAIEYYEKCLWMKEGSASDHPSVGITYGHLASAYARVDRHQLALEYRQKYLANRQKNLESNNPIIGDCLINIGDTYEQLQQPTMALNYYKQASVVYKKSLSANHLVHQKTETNIQRLSDNKCSIQ